AGIGYPLFDVTSSSLNTPSGNFTKAGTRFANEINSYRVGLTYFDTNFGLIDIDWSQPDPVLRLQVRDETGDVVLQPRLTPGPLAGVTQLGYFATSGSFSAMILKPKRRPL